MSQVQEIAKAKERSARVSLLKARSRLQDITRTDIGTKGVLAGPIKKI